MAYRHDPDLEFLGSCKDKELDALVQILTHDPKDKKKRHTESLTGKKGYKSYHPKHSMYWEDIAEEIQRFGGNTISNIFRMGKGVLYREILCDVCKRMKIKYDKTASTKDIELVLLENVIEKTLSDLPEEELKKIANDLNIPSDGIPQSALTAAILKAIHAYLTTTTSIALVQGGVIVGTATATVGTMIGNTIVGRILGVATGPVGWIITTAWMIGDIASPAMRVTIPAVLQVALLRVSKSVENTSISGE